MRRDLVAFILEGPQRIRIDPGECRGNGEGRPKAEADQ